MQSFTEVLVYATWATSPVVAYQALMHGLRRAPGPFVVIFAMYSAAVALTFLSVRAELARNGFGAVSPVAVALPWGATAILSALFYGLGLKGAEKE